MTVTERKKSFVEGELSELLKAIMREDVITEYCEMENGSEFVYIRYKNGSHDRICVTADSLLAIAKDVLESL